MKVLIDYTVFDIQTHGGISRCFSELYSHMPPNVSATIGVLETNNVYLQNLGFHRKGYLYRHFLTQTNFLGKRALFKFSYNAAHGNYKTFDRWPSVNRDYCIQLLKEKACDVFHPSFYTKYFLKYLERTPFVLTVHDMIPELFPQYFPRNDYQKKKKKLLIPQAAHIVAVSERTKQDIIDLMKVPADKITVVYHGTDESAYIPRTKMPFPYILYVGDRNLYKNFGLFFRECVPVLLAHQELRVVCTGMPFSPEEQYMFRICGMSNRFVHRWVLTDQILLDLYHNALVFVYPSAYEGFGIPILEAYKAGCPVMLNRASCFPEIAGDAAIYFHMDERGSDFAEKFEELCRLTDTERTALINRQKERLKRFSWQHAAAQLAQVYQKVTQ